MRKNRLIMTKLNRLLGNLNLLRMPVVFSFLFFTALLNLSIGHAGDADVVDVSVQNLGDNRYTINVTVSHADTGWDHYANGWDVLDENGTVLGTRELLHPHVNEQPFTRSLTITIDSSVKTVTLRANDSVHGNKGVTMSVELPGA